MRRLGLRVFFLTVLFFPYLLLFSHFNQFSLPESSEIFWVLKNTFWQALGSALGSLILGWLLCQGVYQSVALLSGFPKWAHKGLELIRWGLALPFFLPTLFSLLVLLSVIEPFPLGMTGIIVTQTLINAGVIAWILKNHFDEKLLGLGEMAAVHGSSFYRFWRQALIVMKAEIFLVLVFVFSLSITSFSIPLTVGGGFGTTLEVLIYEKIRISGDWEQATFLSLLQLGLLALVSFLPKSQMRWQIGRAQAVSYFRSWIGFGAMIGFLALWILGFAWHAWVGFDKISSIPGLWSETLSLLLPSFLLAFSVSGVLFVLLGLSTLTMDDSFLQKIFVSFLAPSAAILGFVMVFLFPLGPEWTREKWVLGQTLMLFGVLYRWGWAQKIQSLQPQIETAQVLGANRMQQFRWLIVPQMAPLAGQLAGVAFFWALGDFAFSKILMTQTQTLGLLIEALMNNYRLDHAMFLMLILLAMGFAGFLIWKGLAYVLGRKSIEGL